METPATLHKKNAKQVTFESVSIGVTFECNGNLWTKKSTRTASGVWPACLPEWLYFRGIDLVNA